MYIPLTNYKKINTNVGKINISLGSLKKIEPLSTGLYGGKIGEWMKPYQPNTAYSGIWQKGYVPTTTKQPVTEKKEVSGMKKLLTSPAEVVGETVSKVGELGKTIGQAIARSFLATGVELREQLLVPETERKPTGKATYTPQTEIEKKIFGTDKPVSFKSIGEEVLTIGGEDFKEKWGKYSIPIGMVIAGLDITPIGFGKKEVTKNIVKTIAKTNNVAKITKILKTIVKGTDEEIGVLAKSLKLVNKEDDVLKVIKAAGGAKTVSKITPKTTGAIKETIPVKKGIVIERVNFKERIKALGDQISQYRKEVLKLRKQKIKPAEAKWLALERTEETIRGFTPQQTAIHKLTRVLQEAKPARVEQEALYTAERAKRVARVESVGQKISGEKGFFAQLGQLKGPLPKAQFETIRKLFTQKEINSLFNVVQDSKTLLPLEKVTAKGALAKLFEGAIPTKGEIELLREVFPKNFIEAILTNKSLGAKIMNYIGEVINVPRTMMASTDFSAPLRQGMFLIRRQKQFAPNFLRMFKYAFSEKAYQGMMKGIEARSTYKLMRKSKLALTEIGEVGGKLTAREEAFMGNIIEKVPGVGQIVRISNRAYTGFLNKMRVDVFDDILRKADILKVKKTEKFLDSTAQYVNAATGRGNLPGVIEKTAPILNATLFSPRLMASRINLLNPWFYVQLDPFVRKEALKDLLVFGATAGTVLGLASLNDDVEIGADPRSADFGKIKVGNTRYDIFAGFQQYIKWAAQLTTGEIVSSTTGRTMTTGESFGLPTRLDVFSRFFEYKTSPIASFVIGLLRGETSLGEEFDVPTQITNRFISFVVQDLYDIAQEKGIEHIWEGAPAIFGVGVQTYGKQELVFGESKIGEPTAQIRPVQEMAEKIRETVLGEIPIGTSKGFSIEAYYDQLNELPKEEAAEIFDKIARANPDLAKKINNVVAEREKGITPKDKDLKAKGVASGDRALAIQKKLEELKTDEERMKLWDEYVKKGIIIKEVARQLGILMNL